MLSSILVKKSWLKFCLIFVFFALKGGKKEKKRTGKKKKYINNRAVREEFCMIFLVQ